MLNIKLTLKQLAKTCKMLTLWQNFGKYGHTGRQPGRHELQILTVRF